MSEEPTDLPPTTEVIPPPPPIPPPDPVDVSMLPIVNTPPADASDALANNAQSLAVAAAQAEALQAAVQAADSAIHDSALKWIAYARSGDFMSFPAAVPMIEVCNYIDALLACGILNQDSIYTPQRAAFWADLLAEPLAHETIDSCVGYFKRRLASDFEYGSTRPPPPRRPNILDSNAVTNAITRYAN